MIRPVLPSDISSITTIYNYYIEQSSSTFEETKIDEKEMELRIGAVLESDLPWLVYEQNEKVLAYAYVTKWKNRSAYRYSVESSIYADPNSVQKGIGSALYTQLITELKRMKVHVVIGGITLPNTASVRLHEKLGFKKVAEFEEVGFKFEKWRNVGYWQLILNEHF